MENTVISLNKDFEEIINKFRNKPINTENISIVTSNMLTALNTYVDSGEILSYTIIVDHKIIPRYIDVEVILTKDKKPVANRITLFNNNI